MSGDWSRVKDKEFLEAQFSYDVHELLDKLPDPWVVTEGLRTMQRSNDLFINYRLHKGPRAAPGGISPHNYGRAIDVALDGDPIKPGLQALWLTTHPAWQRLVAAIWIHPRLRSGRWYSDWPHIEQLNWKRYVTWRKNYEDNCRYLHSIAGLSKYLPSKFA